MTKRTFNPNKCQHQIVALLQTRTGDSIALLKHHAFDWGIMVQTKGKISITMMPREKARKEYKKRSRCYK